jgi:hypothetical protein
MFGNDLNDILWELKQSQEVNWLTILCWKLYFTIMAINRRFLPKHKIY